tara:strand:+ start:100228 stop:100368 length:141 start_codon:yes stop_codon:yes gene_type:complete
MNYKIKNFLEYVFFFGMIIASIAVMFWFIVQGAEWSIEFAKYILGQ